MLGRKNRTETPQFRKINAAAVHIFEIKANHADSMTLLQRYGLRPMTYQEAIVLIDGNPELKAQLKGKWFYLAGEGLKEGGYYTFNNEGKLTEGKGDIEKTVYIYPGNMLLSLVVHNDEDFDRFCEMRFTLVAYAGPQEVAPVVVGVRADHEVATPKIVALNGPKIDPKLVSEFRLVITSMESATQAGVLNPELIEVAKKVLRAIE